MTTSATRRPRARTARRSAPLRPGAPTPPTSCSLGTVRDVHGAVADRVYGINDGQRRGPTVAQRSHDGIAKAVYGGIGAGFRAASRGLRAATGAAAAPHRGVPARPVRASPRSTG